MKKLNKKIFVASMIGNALKFYDFTIYGFFVAIISPVFFPATNPLTSLISGFGIFALGFLTRPFMPLWAWRTPFFLGSSIGDIELNVLKSFDFFEVKACRRREFFPVKSV